MSIEMCIRDRCEYVEMLENQIAKSNNGIVRTKLLTLSLIHISKQ